MIDLSRDEVLALMAMTGGVPIEDEAWLVEHRASGVRQLAESARAKLAEFVDSTREETGR